MSSNAGVVFSLRSRAPTRIDLAGGTLDLWPIYLFLEKPRTLNLGINLFAETSLVAKTKTGTEAQVRFVSQDQNTEYLAPISGLATATSPPSSMRLHFKLFKHFMETLPPLSQKALKDFDFTISTHAKSPAGAGLGGSSTLSVSIIGALAGLQQWLAQGADPKMTLSESALDVQKDGERWIETVRDIETTVIEVPAGLQDYFGAMYGGLQVIRWNVEWHAREHLASDLLKQVDDRLLLFYSGHSRNSGINNWALFKAFIDKDTKVRESFSKIAAATEALESALRAKDWRGAGVAINDEWQTRKTLAAGISTPEIDGAILAASKIAPISAKICGAGGGGCFFLYLPDADPELRKKIKNAVQSSSDQIRTLEFSAVPHGVQVEQNPSGPGT